MIKLGRAARLWNGPSLRGHKWRNGARFQNCLQTKHNKLADGVLNRLYVKWDFANPNQHLSTKVWIILFQLNFYYSKQLCPSACAWTMAHTRIAKIGKYPHRKTALHMSSGSLSAQQLKDLTKTSTSFRKDTWYYKEKSVQQVHT